MAGALPAAVLAALTAWQLGSLLAGDRDGSGRLAAVAGALAFGLAVAVGVLAVPTDEPLLHPLRLLLLGAALVLLAGLRRDLGRPFRGLTLVAIVLAALLAVVAADLRIRAIKIPFAPEGAPFQPLSEAPAILVTTLWIVAVAVLVRFADPLPGLTAGLGALVSATFLVVAVTRGRELNADVSPLTVYLGAVLLGACAGLVGPGLRGAGVSLGRGGAGMLGYLLGVLSVVGTLKNTAFLLVGLPLLALAVPLANVLYVGRRARRGDRASLAEMLGRRGFGHSRSATLLLALQAYCCLVALALVGLVTVPVILKLLLLALLLPAGFGAFFLISRIAARVATQIEGKVTVLGVPIDSVTYESAVARMAEFIESGEPHHVFTADVSGIMRCREEPELAEIVRTCDLVTADGAGVLWAAKLFDLPLPERVSGVDLVRRLSALAAERGYRVFLLGAQPGVAQAAAEVLARENPGLILAGVEHGYFDDEEALAERIRAAAPQIVFVALGIPRQERFIRRWYGELRLPLCLGIGGSFDVISGRLKRAPVWMQRAGLEWLFRLLQEPKRWRRMLALPRFAAAIAVESQRAWRRGEGR